MWKFTKRVAKYKIITYCRNRHSWKGDFSRRVPVPLSNWKQEKIVVVTDSCKSFQFDIWNCWVWVPRSEIVADAHRATLRTAKSFCKYSTFLLGTYLNSNVLPIRVARTIFFLFFFSWVQPTQSSTLSMDLKAIFGQNVYISNESCMPTLISMHLCEIHFSLNRWENQE